MPAAAALPAVPPYFDILFARLKAKEPVYTTAFGRHVHWGYWPQPDEADGTPEDYARAAERLCHRICDAAGIENGMRVLDVGCGIGGTIASLNERFSNLELVGVNIDPRQLEWARQTIRPLNGNRIRFLQEDACNLPFASDSFDAVLAVESIFHFPDRAAFFAGAGRALVPGGKMALSDFVPPPNGLALLQKLNVNNDEAVNRTYGQIDVQATEARYRELAAENGLELIDVDNISENTLPTYPFLRQHVGSWSDPEEARLLDRGTARLQAACHFGVLHYSILAFRKDREPS